MQAFVESWFREISSKWTHLPNGALVHPVTSFMSDREFTFGSGQHNQGIGSAMVRAFVERVFQDPAVTGVHTDPSPDNQRAIRSYVRAGFVVQHEVTPPDRIAVLMLRDRPRT